MNSEEIFILKKALTNTSNIVIVGHKNPDGDAIGSCLGLANFLKQLEKKIFLCVAMVFVFVCWHCGRKLQFRVQRVRIAQA